MKVLLINTSEHVGGAAIAAHRLMEALKHNGVNASMLVRDRQSQQLTVTGIKASWRLPLKFMWERLTILLCNGLSRRLLWSVDLGTTGTDVTCLPEFQQADVVHLHWVNQSFLSLRDVERILVSGKRVVVTMHDMWYFTGVCHYSGACERYKVACHDCPLMGGHRRLVPDWSERQFRYKYKMYARARVTFVGCSQWIAGLASASALTVGQRVVHVPNAIDTELFCPADMDVARSSLGLPAGKRLVLFSSQRITDPRKGFRLLASALDLLKQEEPELFGQLELVVVGGDSEKVRDEVCLPVHAVSYVESEVQMVQLYNAVDLYVTPSLQDNLPNTIVEALACGTPCVGFRVGGIPEMIDHQRCGYVATYRDARDLACGIAWTLDEGRQAELSANARDKALTTYSEKQVANRYKEIYQSL